MVKQFQARVSVQTTLFGGLDVECLANLLGCKQLGLDAELVGGQGRLNRAKHDLQVHHQFRPDLGQALVDDEGVFLDLFFPVEELVDEQILRPENPVGFRLLAEQIDQPCEHRNSLLDVLPESPTNDLARCRCFNTEHNA